MTDRWDGPDGQWATFRTSYSWGQSRRITSAILTDDVVAFMLALAQETVTSLHVKADGGGWIDQPGDDAWERMDGQAGDAIASACKDVWTAWRDARDPKGTTGTPTDSPPSEA
jgi:hypothetical protein